MTILCTRALICKGPIFCLQEVPQQLAVFFLAQQWRYSCPLSSTAAAAAVTTGPLYGAAEAYTFFDGLRSLQHCGRNSSTPGTRNSFGRRGHPEAKLEQSSLFFVVCYECSSISIDRYNSSCMIG